MFSLRTLLSLTIFSISMNLFAMKTDQDMKLDQDIDKSTSDQQQDKEMVFGTSILINSSFSLFAFSNKNEEIFQMFLWPKTGKSFCCNQIHKPGLTGLRFNEKNDLVATIGDDEEIIPWETA